MFGECLISVWPSFESSNPEIVPLTKFENLSITAMRRIWTGPDCLTTNYEINVMGYVLFHIK